MYLGVFKYLIAILSASILIALSVIVLWFVFGLAVNFYRIYIRPKKQILKECTHDYIIHDGAGLDKPFACTKCGKRF